jgi:hypothetical protein
MNPELSSNPNLPPQNSATDSPTLEILTPTLTPDQLARLEKPLTLEEIQELRRIPDLTNKMI